MTKRLLLPLACAALTLAAPMSTNPRPRNPSLNSFGAYTGNATLFYGVAAEEPPPADPVPETPPDPPEFVMPQSGSGWLDFIFQYAYAGLSEEETSLLRAVLLPQYERFASIFQPAPEPVPPAETAPTVQVALSITSTPLSLTSAPAAPAQPSAPLRSIAPLPLNGIPESRTLLNSAQEVVNVSVTTPEPGALLLFGSGLALLAWRRRAG